ncbi:hypothetical protein FD755_018328, partial [Muntiacus reevesi]
ESGKVSEYPAVIVEPVPSARLEQGYAAQVLVYDDETYMMQDVAEEQEVETENVETDNCMFSWALVCIILGETFSFLPLTIKKKGFFYQKDCSDSFIK